MKKWNKMIIICSWLLVMSLVACQTSQTTSSTTTTTTGTTSTTEGTTADTTTTTGTTSTTTGSTENQPDKSPITLTMGFQGDATIMNGIMEDSAIFDKIKEETGVTIDFRPYSVEKYKVLVAGGDLPDITTVLESHISGISRQLIEAEMIIPLDDLLDKYGENIRKNIPIALKWSKDVQGKGTTYTMPIYCAKADTSTPTRGANITMELRWDLYEAIGKPEINGDEGLLDVAEMMQEYSPVSPEGYKTYAFSGLISNGAIWQYRYTWPRANYYYWAPALHQVHMLTGELESMFTKSDSAFWKSIKFHNMAYQRGLFDPEALTMNDEQYREKVATGQVLIAYRDGLSVNTDIVGETLFVKVPGYIPYVHLLYPLEEPIGWQASHARAITTNCKYPERAMQLLNYLDSQEGARLIFNGLQGTDWDYVDGVPQYIGEYAEALRNNKGPEYFSAKYKIEFWPFSWGYTSGSIIKTDDGYPIDLKTTSAYYSMFVGEIENKWAQQFGADFTYRGQVYEQWYKEGKWETAFEIPLAVNLMAPLSEESTNIQAKAEAYFNENIARVLLAETDAEYETAKQDMINAVVGMGMLEADAEVLRLYQEAQALADSLK